MAVERTDEDAIALAVERDAEIEREDLRIASMPRRWMVVCGDIRRALMKRFPHVILVRLLDEPAIRITVVNEGHDAGGVW